MSLELPRGWTLTSTANGSGTASVTAPATTGVLHVIDAIYAKLIGDGARSPANLAVTLSSSDGIYSSQIISFLTVNASAATPPVDRDDISLSALDISASAGASITITFSAVALGGIIQVLVIQGHDV